ncbi:MAG TPA: sulfatase-like hydrolase/transferase [Tepidisphaeraceae bacterium]|nr:sulfatase-like hydrolase/transferase [Tepidisphaeraceae bacterium]
MARISWSCFAMLLATCLVAPTTAAADRPHIVFVLADDLGLGDLTCYGGTGAPTPNLDRLAKEGTRFARYYVASPICSPSRAALITGHFPARWRLTSYLQTRAGNRGCEQADFLDPAAPSFPRQLQAAGYATAHFGKWHLGGGRDVAGPPKFAAYGYDEHAGTYESPEPHPDITATNWIWSDKDKVKRWDRSAFFVDKALDFVRRQKAANRPAFVNVWLDDPHTPWVLPGGAPKGETKPPNLKGVLTEMDRQIGRLIDGLRELGVERDTLIIFASDNGPLPTYGQSRTAGLRGAKLSLYEGGVRVPLIVRWPGRIPANRVDNDSIVSGVDWLPTLSAIAGAKVPEGYTGDGQDVSAAVLAGQSVERKSPLFWEYGRNEKFFAFPGDKTNRSPSLAALDGKWKLLVNADGGRRELYDLSADAKESTNLTEKEPATADRLAQAVLTWRQSLPKLEDK